MTKFQVGTILTYLTTDGQMHTIGKAIRPLFADPVTNDPTCREVRECICGDAISSGRLQGNKGDHGVVV